LIHFIVDIFRENFPIICFYVDSWFAPYIPLKDNHHGLKYKIFQRTILPEMSIKSSLPEDPLTKRHWYLH